MEKTGLFNLPRLLRSLGLLVLATLVAAVIVTPIVDYNLVAGLPENWTVTKSLYVFLAAAMPMLALGLNGLRSGREKLVLRLIALLFLYAAYITLTAASNLAYPIFGFVTFLGATLAGILFYVNVRDGMIPPTTVFRVLALSAAFVAQPLFLLQWDLPRYLALVEQFRTSAVLYGFENPRAIGWLSSIGLSLAIGHTITRPADSRLSPALLILAVIASTTLFWSGSRAGIVALSASTLVILAISRNRSLTGLLAVLICIVIGAALSTLFYLPDSHFGIFSRITQSAQMENANALSSGRIALWKATLAFIAERPFTGYGLLPHKNIEGLAAGSSHNIILELWLGIGVVFGTLAVACLIWLWITLCLIARASQDRHILALFCLTTTFAVYCLMSGPYARTLPLLIFAIAAGTVLGAGAQRTRATT